MGGRGGGTDDDAPLFLESLCLTSCSTTFAIVRVTRVAVDDRLEPVVEVELVWICEWGSVRTKEVLVLARPARM